MISQEVIFNVQGQTFFFDPPEGKCSGTPTVTIYASTADDQGPTVPAVTGIAAVDAVDTTFSAAGNASQISVASSTGIKRGQRYLISASGVGDREWVTVLAINGNVLNVRQPIQNSYPAASRFQGCRISIAVDPVWVTLPGNITDVLDPTGRAWLTTQTQIAWIPGASGYRLRWAYTILDTGANTIGVSFGDLVRYQAKNLISPLHVDQRFPGWLDRLSTDYQEDQGVSLIEEAFLSIKMDALGDSQVLRRIRSSEVMRELTIHKANVMAIEASVMAGGKGGSLDALKLAQERYQQRYDQLIREPKVPVDQVGQGASMDPVREHLWRR